MNRTFIWGHRGVGIHSVENTIDSFQKAVEMGVDGIETDAYLSKDEQIVLFHDYFVEKDGKKIEIKKLTLKEIKEISLKGNKTIPTLGEVFDVFKSKNIKYSIDLKGNNVGFKIIKLAKEYNILEKVELVGNNFYLLSRIRAREKDVKLIYSISERHPIIAEKDLKFNKMNKLNIYGFNIRNIQAKLNFFKQIKNAGFGFYVWAVDTRLSMKRFLKMNYNGKYVDAIYTNYPDILLELRDKIQRQQNLGV